MSDRQVTKIEGPWPAAPRPENASRPASIVFSPTFGPAHLRHSNTDTSVEMSKKSKWRFFGALLPSKSATAATQDSAAEQSEEHDVSPAANASGYDLDQPVPAQPRGEAANDTTRKQVSLPQGKVSIASLVESLLCTGLTWIDSSWGGSHSSDSMHKPCRLIDN